MCVCAREFALAGPPPTSHTQSPCTDLCVSVCMHVRICVCARIRIGRPATLSLIPRAPCTYLCVSVYMGVRMCVCVYVCVCARIRISTPATLGLILKTPQTCTGECPKYMHIFLGVTSTYFLELQIIYKKRIFGKYMYISLGFTLYKFWRVTNNATNNARIVG